MADMSEKIEIPKGVKVLLTFPGFTQEEVGRIADMMRNLNTDRQDWLLSNWKVKVIEKTNDLVVLEVKKK